MPCRSTEFRGVTTTRYSSSSAAKTDAKKHKTELIFFLLTVGVGGEPNRVHAIVEALANRIVRKATRQQRKSDLSARSGRLP